MDTRFLKLGLLVLASVMMIPLGLHLGQMLKGGAKPMSQPLVAGTDAQGRERTVQVTAELKAGANAELSVTIKAGDDVLVDAAPFARASVMTHPPEFNVYVTPDDTLIALWQTYYPEQVLFIYDTATGQAWPSKLNGETDDELFANGEAMLERLRTGHDEVPDEAALLVDGFMPAPNDRMPRE